MVDEVGRYLVYQTPGEGLVFIGLLCFHNNLFGESNPHKFIDSQAQAMVSIIRNNQELYAEEPELFKDKINVVFEPMVDFRRVGASVMGKKYYLAASKLQRIEFIESFRISLLDTYSSTLAQWGDQKIVTVFPDLLEFKKTEDVQLYILCTYYFYLQLEILITSPVSLNPLVDRRNTSD